MWRGDLAKCCTAPLWEQSLLAKQAPRFLKDRIAAIAGKPCSHSGQCVPCLQCIRTCWATTPPSP
ncbi:hypothetical protein B0E42_01015 [Pseudomonas sp. A25(2017)]|nr:hypothetical protein B0E42_01015 [Pseudomonas sp. A25(2017)]